MDLDVREEFKLAAALRGATMSSLVHQYAFQIIREEREEYPAAFIYLNAGGSVENAVKIAREFGKRPISDEDRANIRKMAEAEQEEAQRANVSFSKPNSLSSLQDTQKPAEDEEPTIPINSPFDRYEATLYEESDTPNRPKGGKK